MVAALGGVAAGRDRQPAFEHLANLGALLARDGEEFGVIVRREVAREAGVDAFLADPALPLGQRAAAQFDRWDAERPRHGGRALRERSGDGGFVGQYTALDREAAADARPSEERRTDLLKQNGCASSRERVWRDE